MSNAKDKNLENRDIASPETAAAELKAMSKADLVRMEQFARLRATGLPWFDWEDLLHEAIDRVLSGSRRWPRSVPFVAFMCGTIRSISSEWWRGRALKNESSMSRLGLRDGESFDAVELIEDGKPSPESEVAARQSIKKIEALFSKDEAALGVLHGFAVGSTPSEIQENLKMTETEYASTQRRIRRRISRAVQEGKI